MATYVPRVLVCGDDDDFRKIIGDRPVEVVGRLQFERAVLLLDGHRLTGADVAQLLDTAAEYLLFTDAVEFERCIDSLPTNGQVLSAVTFAKKIRGGFLSFESLATLFDVLKNFRGRVLDVDCFVAKADLRTNDLPVELECVAGNFDGLRPIHENLYGKIYRTLDDCRYRHFDAVLLTDEREPDEFVDAMIKTDALSQNVLTFVRRGSLLESWLTSSQNIFADVKTFSVAGGAWWLIEKRAPVDVGVYVVTHKDAKLSAPEGYRVIHAGHINAAQTFGDVTDDTGDNISELNPFLDEITALYWVWKNTSHTHTGIVHYRRLLTDVNQPNRPDNRYIFHAENILSASKILQLLDDYDIITHTEFMSKRTQRELMILSTKQPALVAAAEEIVRRHLQRTHPDYLATFDDVMNGSVFFAYGIFVTRRKIFDDYCAWLFSFIIDATIELRDTVTLGGHRLTDAPHVYSRMMSFFAERMLTVWLTNNRLRIKTLPIMYRDDI